MFAKIYAGYDSESIARNRIGDCSRKRHAKTVHVKRTLATKWRFLGISREIIVGPVEG